MLNFARYMEQKATYWAPDAHDGFGGRTFVAPVVINCRWQDTATLFRDAQGVDAVSDAVVYVDRVLEVRGYLALGEHTTITPPIVAKEIRQKQVSPSLSNDEELHKVFL